MKKLIQQQKPSCSGLKIKAIALFLLFTAINLSGLRAQYILKDSFEGESLNRSIWGVTWWTPHGQLDQGIEPEIVTSPVRYGEHAVKIRAQYNWNNIIDYTRTEITGKRSDNGQHMTFFYPGRENWIGFSVYLPADWETDPISEELLFQLHGNQGDRSPSLALVVDGTEWYWHIQWGAKPNDPGIDGKKTIWRGDYEKGEWIDFVIHARWSYSDNGYGFMEIWKNGESLVQHSGPNCYNDDMKIRGPQTGVYKWNWSDGSDFTATERTVYLDEFKVGGRYSTYEDVVPGQPGIVVRAAFRAKREPCSPQVKFENKSFSTLDGIDSYAWDFGDGETSNKKSPKHYYSSPGIYPVKLIVVDGELSDTVVNNVTLRFASEPTDVSATTNNDGTLTLKATGTGIINWYDTIAGGELLGSGSVFTTSVTNKKVFYAENVIGGMESATGGNMDKGTGNYYKWDDNDAMWGLKFNADYDCTLKNVTVYNGESENGSYVGERTFTLIDNNMDTIAQTTLNVVEGEQKLALNMNVPAGNGYALLSDRHVGLWRTTEGVSYPYPVGNYVTITGGVRYDGLPITDGYHFFYNWEVDVDVPSCASRRVATDGSTSVEENLSNKITIYPNPANRFLYIDALPEVKTNYLIKLFNSNMQLVKAVSSKGTDKVKINIDNLTPGIYFCKVSSPDNTVLMMKKIVVIQ